MANALGKLAALAGKNARMNITPGQGMQPSVNEGGQTIPLFPENITAPTDFFDTNH